MLRLWSQKRTTCSVLKTMDLRSLKTLSPSSSGPVILIGPIWRQAMDASEVSTLVPTHLPTPPVTARLR